MAAVVRSDRDTHRREGRARSRSETREAPRWCRALDKGSPRTAFFVGILLTLPGASYLVGMARISEENSSTVSPDATRRGVTRFTDCVSANARKLIGPTAFVLGSLLLKRAAIELVA